MEKDKYTIRKARISDAVRIRELLKTWLTEAPFNFGNKKFMRTLWLHVNPKYRNFKIFRSIMIVFKEYAFANKVTAICEIFQGKDLARKDQAFNKLGFKVIGGTYIING